MIRTPKVTGSPDEIWLTYGRTGADDDPGLGWIGERRTPDDVRYVRAPRARPRNDSSDGYPPVIWLNYGELERDATHAELFRDGDVTWSEDQVFDSDVRYIRVAR